MASKSFELRELENLAELSQTARATRAVGSWIAGIASAIVASAFVGVVGWTALEVRELRIEVTRINTTLEAAPPAEVIAELRGVRDELAAANVKLDAAIGAH